MKIFAKIISKYKYWKCMHRVHKNLNKLKKMQRGKTRKEKQAYDHIQAVRKEVEEASNDWQRANAYSFQHGVK